MLALTISRPYDETHEWRVVEQYSDVARAEKCSRCGLRVRAGLGAFGFAGWQRIYSSDRLPCEQERERRELRGY